MNKLLGYVLLLTLAAGTSVAKISEAEQRANVILQARQMQGAFMRGEIDSFITFMNPRFLAKFGGRDSLAKEMKAGFKEVIASLRSFSTGTPSKIYSLGNQLQCLIPDTVNAVLDVGPIQNVEQLLAVSDDGGVNWKFINAGVAMVNFAEFKETQPVAPEIEALLREKFVLPVK